MTAVIDNRSATEQYRDSAEEIRQMAERVHSKEIRDDLLILAERYDRLARRADKSSE